MSVRSDVLLWAQRIVAKKDPPPHQLLEISADARIEVAQDAFHKIACLAHPDLHRNSLTDEELALVSTAYARVVAAYQYLRKQTMQTGPLPPLPADPPPPRPRAPSTGPLAPRAQSPQSSPLAAGSSPDVLRPATLGALGVMSSKALLYYRKAELCLRRGDLKQAVLQLKLAIACDPQSAFLRTALAQVEAEVGK
ncbi:MAG TPA: hypothetical protein VNO30_15750 [Kofleriaceae bacterium]|nr:hypothetical protein [Kofleriaceae bacterium]